MNKKCFEQIILCPSCKNKTLIISKRLEYNICTNINCGYSEVNYEIERMEISKDTSQ